LACCWHKDLKETKRGQDCQVWPRAERGALDMRTNESKKSLLGLGSDLGVGNRQVVNMRLANFYGTMPRQ
jgi:hypothetical protein